MKGQLSRGRKKPDDCVSLVKQKKPTFKRWGLESSREERRKRLQEMGAGLEFKLCASEQRLSYGLIVD